ncbi:MAG TPA: hypothetical protein VME45_15345 [Stellaceae bacterium]|nr:hypothetical protein [Stellaceae bacterium]
MKEEDPRWEQALKHWREAEAAYASGEFEAMIRAFERHLNILDSLAVDPAVPRAERRGAAKLVEKIDSQFRAHLPALLHRLAELRDTSPDADKRAEFADILVRATAQLPAASTARH